MPSEALRAVVEACRSQKPVLSSAYDPVAFRALMPADPALGAPVSPIGAEGLAVELRGAGATAVMVALAGGGFCFPPSDAHRRFLDHVAAAIGARVHLLHPRLAPEWAFPAAHLDACAGVAHAFEAADGMPLVAVADSSGAALLLSALLDRRDRGLALPLAVVLVSSLTDCAMTGYSHVENAAADPMFGPEAIIHKVHHWLQGHNPTDWRASPLWGDLRGLPPMLLFAGSTEVMLDDSRRLAQRVIASGGAATLVIEAEAPHDYPLLDDVPESRAAREAITAFLADHLASTAPARRSSAG